MKSLFGVELNKTIIPAWFDQNLVDEESEKQGLVSMWLAKIKTNLVWTQMEIHLED